MLEQMRGLVTAGGFDPSAFRGSVSIAANDLQRDLLLPSVLRTLRRQAPGLSLRIIPSGVPMPELLRDGQCQLVISPRPPEAADLVQKRLFEDRYMVFFDPSCRHAPVDLADYLAADHVTVVYAPRRPLDLDRALEERGVARRFVASVPGFAGLAPFLRGSACLATAPSLLSRGLLAGLARCSPPLPCPPLPMFMVWHMRHQADPMHRWLRQAVDAAAEPLRLADPTAPA
jgi:DNA-binding transcriptional LysR family regulator